MDRYAAKLLFQFRVTVAGGDFKRRLCEERIIILRDTSAKRAYAQAQRKGRIAQHSYLNGDGNLVRFEFIGVMELMHLGLECEHDEVWYEMKQRLLPDERQDDLIPPPAFLAAFRHEAALREASKEK